MAEINEEYKDRLFSFIFGQEKNRAKRSCDLVIHFRKAQMRMSKSGCGW